jgi:site-specific recombinase XerD
MSNDAATYNVDLGASADGGDRVPDLSPREAFERWMSRLRVDKREATISSYHYRVKLFVEWCEREGIETIGEVTGWDIESYETERRGTDVEAVTLNKELGTVQNWLEYCARVELVDENLPAKVDPPDVGAQADIDETRLTTAAAEALFDYYEAEAYGTRDHTLLALAWYTGARLNALRGLSLQHYDRDEALVEFIHQPDRDLPLKNGYDGERAVGLPEAVVDVLDAYIAEHRHDVHDDRGDAPLLASQVGRASRNAVRSWCYLATVPCLHMACPHGNDPDTCEYLDYSKSSQCPSSRSPHQVRTGSITWQLNRGIPIEVVAERVNTSVRVLKRHYDKPTRREALEERRRHHLDQLSFGDSGGASR